MNKLLRVLGYGALALALAYGTYTWGWYRGMNTHAVLSGMSEAKWSLSAAQSLRKSDPQLALELLEANIAWMDASLKLEPEDVPADQRANYALVLQRLAEYRESYGVIGSD